jgi:hypothetical protein
MLDEGLLGRPKGWKPSRGPPATLLVNPVPTPPSD